MTMLWEKVTNPKKHQEDIQNRNVHSEFLDIVADHRCDQTTLEIGDVVTVYINGVLYRVQQVKRSGRFHIACSKVGSKN